MDFSKTRFFFAISPIRASPLFGAGNSGRNIGGQRMRPDEYAFFFGWKPLQFESNSLSMRAMTKPLVLVFYENLLPGSQLINRLTDLGYRVLSFHDSYLLEDQSHREKPLLVVADLSSKKTDVCAAIRKLKENSSTAHIPVLAFTSEKNVQLQESARAAGATLVASDTAILEQLPHLLAQALEV